MTLVFCMGHQTAWAQDELFVIDQQGPYVTVYDRTAAGDAAPLRRVLYSGFRNLHGISVDTVHDEIIVWSSGSNSLQIFPRTANGFVAPSREIRLSTTPIGGVVDTLHDEIVTASGGCGNSSSITVYRRSANGSTAPLRTIAGPATGLSCPWAIALDPVHDEIAVTSSKFQGGANSISFFSRTANGNVAPLRTIVGSATGLDGPIDETGPWGIVVDPANDEVAVISWGIPGAGILVFDRNATGNVAPLRKIVGPATGMVQPVALALDHLNGLFLVGDFGGSQGQTPGFVLTFSRTASGNVAPVRALSGPSTLLKTPLFLDVTPVFVPQVGTRLTVPGGSATTSTITPGSTVSFEVRIDAPLLKTIGAAYTLSETSSAGGVGHFTIVGRSTAGSPYNDTLYGRPDSVVLALPSALLDPASKSNLGEAASGLVGIAQGSNLLAQTIALRADPSTPVGTHRIQPTAGASFVTDDALVEYDMSAAFFDVVVGQTLQVAKSGSGTGTVVADSGAINCGAVCSDIYVGTQVTLTATPDSNSTFAGWSGGGCSGTGTCTVTVNAAISVTATFNSSVLNFPLNVFKNGSGSGLVASADTFINCGTTCSASYASGSVATLTATPAGGSVFAGWVGGGCSGTNSCVVTVAAPMAVTATFNAQPASLSVVTAGNGKGTVTSGDGFINCGAICSALYSVGSPVTLTAAPGTGQNFAGWSGGGCNGTGTCAITINGALTVTATFTDTTPPDTTLTGHPSDPSGDLNPSFTFASTEAGSTFECALDGGLFAACASPWQVHVAPGSHGVQVRAIDAALNVDPTPASFSWVVTNAGPPQEFPIPLTSARMLAILAILLMVSGWALRRRSSSRASAAPPNRA